ncbi:MAG: hypothetical protein ISR86_10565 [Nitrospinaceae bacterium]|nr:hypothetical protein [Nitrospinaceae bacterium]
MIDEIDYFPRRDRHNKKKKVDSGWRDLKKEKSEQDAKVQDEKKKNDNKPPPTRRGANEQ